MSMTTPLAAPNGFSVTSLMTNLAAALRLLGSFTATVAPVASLVANPGVQVGIQHVDE